jgi:DNA-directed RNA polymerase beta' subunit
MKIDILDIEKLIEINDLKEVSSPRLFSNKMMYDTEGILSSEIFGISKGDRRSTFAYIDLKRHYIHPHIYSKVLKGMFKNIIYIVSGQRYYSVKDGQLVEDEENGWTGLESLYEHWDEINWRKSKSNNATNKQLMINLTKDQVFITKTLVCPPAYRDVMIAGTVDSSDHVNELNNLYVKLIRMVSLLNEGGLFAATQYATQMKVQDTLVEIMVYFKNQISKKQGLIRKNLIGKSVDYGVRAVISAPTYNNENINDNMVDIEHVALPISHCCSTFYPFIESWLKNFFTREIINDPNLVTYYDYDLKKEITASLKDPDIQFSEKSIRKMINDYCLNPDNRFKVINVDVVVPSTKGDKIVKASIILKGKILLENNIQQVLNRSMTVTDILYLACVDVCEKRHVMVSRYPVGTDKGIYFNKIRVQSTTQHVNLIFNGKEYPFYPKIDFDIPQDKVGVQFIDTLVMSNSHLDGMGADYDGDQVSIRGIWSDEANLEAEQIMNQKMSALNITGTNAKGVAKEVFNSLYELTKIADSGKHISEADQEKYLSLKPDSITRNLLADMFADMVNSTEKDRNVGKRKPRHRTWDIISVPKNYFFEGSPAADITIGRFIANKFMFESSGIISILGIFNNVMNKSSIGTIDNLVGQIYMEDKINRQQFNTYLEHRDTLGYWLNGMLAHTISEKMLKPLPEVEKKKAELCKKYEKELAEGNIDVMTMISDELVAYAKEILKDDPGMDLYLSGDLDFGNNYKNNAILKGAVINKITNEYDFISSSFMGGIEIKDIPAHANSILASQYPASIATADAGYMGKKLLALLQMMEIDEPGTDCGTKHLVPIKITKHNSKDMLYTYIDDGSGQLKMLDKDNISSYIGQNVMMRSPMTCTTDKICSKCAGNLFYMLDVKHAGLFATQISHAALNLGLKAKHNSLVELYTFNPDNLIEDI